VVATYLCTRAAGDGALELEESTGDLVADGSVALLVVDAAMEETASAGLGAGGGGVVVVRLDVCWGLFWV